MIATIDELILERFLRKRNSGKLIWKDSQGNIIPIKDLNDDHLENILSAHTKHLEQTTNIKASSLNFY